MGDKKDKYKLKFTCKETDPWQAIVKRQELGHIILQIAESRIQKARADNIYIPEPIIELAQKVCKFDTKWRQKEYRNNKFEIAGQELVNYSNTKQFRTKFESPTINSINHLLQMSIILLTNNYQDVPCYSEPDIEVIRSVIDHIYLHSKEGSHHFKTKDWSNPGVK